jgi:cell division protein FtsI (penicillin-binding protein 3)
MKQQIHSRSRLASLLYLDAEKSSPRVGLLILAFMLAFLCIIARLVYLTQAGDGSLSMSARASTIAKQRRPDIVDRNGVLLATSVPSMSVFAEPRKIIDPDEASELISAVLPEVDARGLRQQFSSKKGFSWVKRRVSPREQAEIQRLGIPGIGFWPENRRIYPNGRLAAHILGATDVDGAGIAGIEKYLDNAGLSGSTESEKPQNGPVTLSLDVRVQHALADELNKGFLKYRAKAAAGMVLNVNTGEVIALASLPDFDPAAPADALRSDNMNRIAVGVYEMGSTFKALTVAMALDSGKATINSSYSTAAGAMHFGRQVIREYHGTGRTLTVPEVFLHSSNLGSIKMALSVGVDGHQAFLKKMAQLDRMRTELPESAEPIVPTDGAKSIRRQFRSAMASLSHLCKRWRR